MSGSTTGFGSVYIKGWMWLFTGDLSTRDHPESSRATMPPSQTLSSCVFHCKSAMKSSTLISERMRGYQALMYENGASSKGVKSKHCLLKRIQSTFLCFNFLANVSSEAHLLPFNSFSLSPYFPSFLPPLSWYFLANLAGYVSNPSTMKQNAVKKNKK